MESIEHQITLVEGKETKSLKYNHIVVIYFLVNYWNIDCWEHAAIVGKGSFVQQCNGPDWVPHFKIKSTISSTEVFKALIKCMDMLDQKNDAGSFWMVNVQDFKGHISEWRDQSLLETSSLNIWCSIQKHFKRLCKLEPETLVS